MPGPTYTPGDTYGKIAPKDALIFDTSGNVVGVRNPNGSGEHLRIGGNLTAAQVAATKALVSAHGISYGTAAATTAANLAILNAASANGGEVILPGGRGTILVSGGPWILPSNTRISGGAGTRIKAAAGRAQPFIINKNAGVLHGAIYAVRSSNVVTWQDKQHWRKVGDVLFINGGPDASFRGVVTVTSISANSWTCASVGSNSTAGTLGQYYNVIPVRRSLAGSAFVAQGSTGYINVADPGHDLRPGDGVYLGQDGGSAFAPGIVFVTRVDANQWTFFVSGLTGTGTGTIILNYEQEISIDCAAILDGNRDGTVNQQDPGHDVRLSAAWVGLINGLCLNAVIGGSSIRGVASNNCNAVYLGPRFEGFDCLVQYQAEGGGSGCVVDQAASGSSQLDTLYPVSVSVASTTRGGSGNLVATVTTTVPHNLRPNCSISTAGFTPAQFNVGVVQLIAASGSTFTYNMATAPANDATVMGSYNAAQQCDDAIAFTGTQFASGAAGNYDSVISPYGLTFYEGIEVRSINAYNSLNGLKLTAMASCPFKGVVKVGRIFGGQKDGLTLKTPGAAVRVMDDGPGLVGTKLDSLVIDGPIDWASAKDGSVANALQVSGAGTIRQIHVANAAPTLGVTSVVQIGGSTIDLVDVDKSYFLDLGSGRPSIQILAGATVQKLKVRNADALMNTSFAMVALTGGICRAIEFENIVVDAAAVNTGKLLSLFSTSAGLRSVTFRGITSKNGGLAIGSLMEFGGTAMAFGTIDVYIDDVDLSSSCVITTSLATNTGTLNVYLGPKVRWAPSGSLAFLQVGGTASTFFNLFGQHGTVIPAQKALLFGYGTAVFRLHLPSSAAQVNVNDTGYNTMGGVVNGDVVWNSAASGTAGTTLAIGPVIRRSGAWAVL